MTQSYITIVFVTNNVCFYEILNKTREKKCRVEEYMKASSKQALIFFQLFTITQHRNNYKNYLNTQIHQSM